MMHGAIANLLGRKEKIKFPEPKLPKINLVFFNLEGK